MAHINKEAQKLFLAAIRCRGSNDVGRFYFSIFWLCFLWLSSIRGLFVPHGSRMATFASSFIFTHSSPVEKSAALPEASVEVSWSLSDSERSLYSFFNKSPFVQENTRLCFARPGAHAMPRFASLKPLRLGLEGGAGDWEGVESLDF